MRPIILTALLLTVLYATSASGQEFSPMPAPVTAREPNFGIHAAETGGGLAGYILGAAVGGGIGALAFYSIEHDFRGALLLAPPAAIVGCAGGTYLMGNALDQQGRFLPTLAYSAGAFGVGAFVLFAGTQSSYIISWAGAAVLAAVPVAATIGYNRSRPRETVGGRFLPGSVALGSVRDADGVAHPSLNVRLVNVRF